MKYLSISLLSLVLVFSSSTLFAADIEAITKPDADVLLAFVRGGRIKMVRVAEGDRVRTGTILASQEDSAERIQFRQLKEKAEDRTRIAMAEAELRQKREDLKKMEAAKQDGAVTVMEVEHARFEVETAELSLQMAEFERAQLALQRDELEARLEQLVLASPLSGQVEEIEIEEGEAAEPLSPVFRIVRIDPLRIDAQVPLEIARSLVAGGKVQIYFPVASTGNSPAPQASGVIRNIAAVADAASDTLRVRIAVTNPGRRPAGERVRIQF